MPALSRPNRLLFTSVMSFVSEYTVLKRFTYDWLIRFAELHPFENFNYDNDDYDRPPDFYNPLLSKYASISPRFTALINAHMPYIFYDFYIIDGKIKENAIPSRRKYTVYICACCQFGRNMFRSISWFQNNRVIFYPKVLRISPTSPINENSVTVNELKYLLKQCPRDREIVLSGVLSIRFSEIWPLVKHSEIIYFDLTNMVYDDNIANILRKNQVFPNEMGFYRLDISDKVVLELLDLFLVKFNSLLVRPMVLLLAFQRLKPITLSEAIVEKIVSAGRFDGFCNIPEIPFNLVIIESNEDGKTLSCDFRTDTTI